VNSNNSHLNGQHREMLDQVFETFGIQPNLDLGLMKHGQKFGGNDFENDSCSRSCLRTNKAILCHCPSDTTTTFVASLAAFYRRIPFDT